MLLTEVILIHDCVTFELHPSDPLLRLDSNLNWCIKGISPSTFDGHHNVLLSVLGGEMVEWHQKHSTKQFPPVLKSWMLCWINMCFYQSSSYNGKISDSVHAGLGDPGASCYDMCE